MPPEKQKKLYKKFLKDELKILLTLRSTRVGVVAAGIIGSASWAQISVPKKRIKYTEFRLCTQLRSMFPPDIPWDKKNKSFFLFCITARNNPGYTHDGTVKFTAPNFSIEYSQ